MAKQGQYFFRGHTLNNSGGPVYDTYTVTPTGGSASPLQPAFLPSATEVFGYDDDGNLTSDGRWVYTYVSVVPGAFLTEDRSYESYDVMVTNLT